MAFADCKTVKGRKEYQCDLCANRIRKGARHVVMSGVNDDGDHFRIRMHEVCYAATDDWDDREWEERSEADFCEALGLPLLPA